MRADIPPVTEDKTYMKLLKRIGGLTFFVIVSLLLTTGCGKSKLATPKNPTINELTMTLSWDGVENATNYIVNANGKNYVVSKNSFELVNLDAGSYSLKVKSRNAKGDYSDSGWTTTLKYERAEENGLVYTLTNMNSEYMVTSVGTAQGKVEIGDYYNGKPVTAISDKAFSAASKITGIKIGDNVKTIGLNAFSNCSNLETVEFGANVEKIGQYAFQGCRGLKSVVLPEKLTTVSEYAFRYCRGLTSLTMNSGLTDIKEGAFASCDRLITLNIPDSVKTIGKSAFENCDHIESVTFGNGVTTIGESAFSSNTALSNVKFGQAITNIGTYAFYKCVKIQSLDLPESLVTIEKSAFNSCSALESVNLKSSLKKIGEYAFAGTKFYDNPENGVYYVGNWAVGTKKDATEYKIKRGTIGIADGAFRGCNELKSVDVPDEVIWLGDYAFTDCTQLQAVNIGKGVTTISKFAFQNCVNLGKSWVRIGENVTEIGNYAFYGCKMLGNAGYIAKYPFTLPTNLSSIGTYAFKNTAFWSSMKSGGVYIGKWLVGYIPGENETEFSIANGTIGVGSYVFFKSPSLEIVTIPDSLKVLGKGAFAECPKLLRVITGDYCQLTEINDFVFYKCSVLEEVDIPIKTKIIGKSAFYKSGIKEITIPKNVEEISDYAFYGCQRLYKLTFADDSSLRQIGKYAFSKAFSEDVGNIALPNGVEAIGERAFYKCENLKNISIGSSLEEIGLGVFEACSSLESIVIPDSVKIIGNRAFSKCEALKLVDFGSGVTEIGNYAFYKCGSLKQVTIPSNVTKIGDYAFRNCSLTNLYLANTISEMGSHVFNGNISLTFFVQSEDVPSGWSSRWNSSYRPVIFGASLSEDGSYVCKFVKNENSIINDTARNGISAPEREGYVFVCWKSDSGETYGKDTIINAPNGVTYYAEWREKTPEDEDNATESDETTDSESGNTELSEAA